jgi:hypothetical protein
MAKFIENNQWVELPLEVIYRLFDDSQVGILPTQPRVEPITLENGTFIDAKVAKIELAKIAIQRHLDAWAKDKGYDSIHTAALRAAYDGPYKAEGVAFAQWMDAVWQKAYELLEQFENGQLVELNESQLIAALPAFTGV